MMMRSICMAPSFSRRGGSGGWGNIPSLNGIVQHFPRVFKPRPPSLDTVCLGTVFAASARGRGREAGKGRSTCRHVHSYLGNVRQRRKRLSNRWIGDFLMTKFKIWMEQKCKSSVLSIHIISSKLSDRCQDYSLKYLPTRSRSSNSLCCPILRTTDTIFMTKKLKILIFKKTELFWD